MNVLDTDVLSSFAYGTASIVQMVNAQPPEMLSIPIIAIEEIFRGRLAAIRKFDTAHQTEKRLQAYIHLQESFIKLNRFNVLTLHPAAEALAMQWKHAKIKVGIQDMRIAAIAIINNATLVTRNVRDYAQIPSLNYTTW